MRFGHQKSRSTVFSGQKTVFRHTENPAVRQADFRNHAQGQKRKILKRV